MALRRCLDCPRVIDARALTKGRCPTCAHRHRPPGYTPAAAAHVAANPRCVHCGATSDLTAGHRVPGNARAGFITECRSCGSAVRF